MFSFRYWLADRSELIRRIVELENIIIGLREDRDFWGVACFDSTAVVIDLSDQLKVAETNADVFRDQRDEARAKLVPPTRDPVTGRWARASLGKTWTLDPVTEQWTRK